MMSGRWRLWFWMVLLLAVGVAVGSAAFIVYSRAQISVEALVETLVGVASVVTSTAAWLLARSRPTPAPWLSLERTADELAEQLRRQWERAAAEQGLLYPPPIPLRWRSSSRQVTGQKAEAIERRFPPLPRMSAVTVEDLQSGTLKDLLGVYGGLGSGRLIILGDTGAGKSGAAVLLLREALSHRAAVTTEDQALVPVPVLVTPQGWNPTNELFIEWLAARLARDYPLLRAPEYGEDTAIRLIEGHHLAIIIDGLDEIPEAWRLVALRELDKQVTFRLVLLTRSEELAPAGGKAHLRGAAALELLPVDSMQAAEYLASCQIDPLPAPWRRLIDHLWKQPDGFLAQALNTPLMLTLVRDTYGPEEKVDELIDFDNHWLGSVENIKDHLLDRVLTDAYASRPGRPVPPCSADEARRWLGQLARRMDEHENRDLEWWATPHWMPAWTRAFFTVVIISLCSTILIGPLAALATHTGLFFAIQKTSPGTINTVFSKTLGYAFMFGAGMLVMSLPGAVAAPKQSQSRWSRSEILTILLLGIGVGVGVGLESGFGLGSVTDFASKIKHALAVGFVSSFVVGLGLVLGGGPPQPLGWLRWRRSPTLTNLLVGLPIGLVAGLVAGLGYWLGYGHRFGLVYGFVAGVGYLVVIVVGGRPSQQRSQLQRSRIDTPTTLLVGLVIAIVTSGGYGVIYVLSVILGEQSMLRSRLRWSRTITPTTLLSGLMAGLVLGLVYGLVYALVYGLTYGYESGFGLGLTPGLTFGLGFGLTIGLVLGLRQPPTEATSPLDPQSMWRRERLFGIVFGLMFGLMSGLTGGLVDALLAGPEVGLVLGVTGGIVFGLGAGMVSSSTWTVTLANAQLWRRNEAPAHMLRFLDDARKRQILRKVGPVYQFRDARLQDRLAKACESIPRKSSDTDVAHPFLPS
jgi:hypothetical protein